MARFQREAQVLAALNHPHIAAIYGVESSAIVMELVAGKNLAGPVPVDEAIAIARQMADALDAAHQKNIIHRDLKTANVKIRTVAIAKPAESSTNVPGSGALLTGVLKVSEKFGSLALVVSNPMQY